MFNIVPWANKDKITETKLDQMSENDSYIPKLFIHSNHYQFINIYKPTQICLIFVYPGTDLSAGHLQSFRQDLSDIPYISSSLFVFNFIKISSSISNVRIRTLIMADNLGVDFAMGLSHFNPTNLANPTQLFLVNNKNVANVNIFEPWDSGSIDISAVPLNNILIADVGIKDARAAENPDTTVTAAYLKKFFVEIT